MCSAIQTTTGKDKNKNRNQKKKMKMKRKYLKNRVEKFNPPSGSAPLKFFIQKSLLKKKIVVEENFVL